MLSAVRLAWWHNGDTESVNMHSFTMENEVIAGCGVPICETIRNENAGNRTAVNSSYESLATHLIKFVRLKISITL